MGRIAFIFPGQGSQYVGMGKDFYDTYPSARAVYDQAAAVLGGELLDIIFSGPEEVLQKTEITQPAILTTSVAICRVIEEMGWRAEGLAGLSLGEYSALVAGGAISFEDALPLVQKRGRYMQEAVPLGLGTMLAIVGLSREEVLRICAEAGERGVVVPANYNSPGQVVISGHRDALNYAGELARQAGAKKITELKVSAPFHSPLLFPVQEKLAGELDRITLRRPSVPLVVNVSAKLLADPQQIREALIRQVSNTVFWEDSMVALINAGFDTFLELGPGKTLTGLMKRINPAAYHAAVEDLPALDKVLARLKEVS